MPSISNVDPAEIADLAARYGTPIVWSRKLAVSAQTVQEREKKSAKRRGEVVFAMPRPDHRVLLHTKSFYPAGFYRLPSGGIGIGEPVEAAAQREILEETSLSAGLARFMGVVQYEFRHESDHAEFVSYIFMTTETKETPQVLDEDEQIADFAAVKWSELEHVAESLEQLPGAWHDWGVFRAVPHRLVLQAVKDFGIEL